MLRQQKKTSAITMPPSLVPRQPRCQISAARPLFCCAVAAAPIRQRREHIFQRTENVIAMVGRYVAEPFPQLYVYGDKYGNEAKRDVQGRATMEASRLRTRRANAPAAAAFDIDKNAATAAASLPRRVVLCCNHVQYRPPHASLCQRRTANVSERRGCYEMQRNVRAVRATPE
jgi:hypothetical protein